MAHRYWGVDRWCWQAFTSGSGRNLECLRSFQLLLDCSRFDNVLFWVMTDYAHCLWLLILACSHASSKTSCGTLLQRYTPQKLRCNRKWMNPRYLDILFGNHHFHIPPCFFGCIVNIGWLIDWLPWRSKIGQSWSPQGTLYDLPDCLKPNSPASIVAMVQCMRSILYMICIASERERERERKRVIDPYHP